MNAASEGTAPELAHRLAVILCADVVGYSRLMGIDEEGTLAALEAVRRNLVDPKVLAHRGRIARTMGDGLVVEFALVRVICADGVHVRTRSKVSTVYQPCLDSLFISK